MIVNNDLTNPSVSDVLVTATVPDTGLYRIRFLLSASAAVAVRAYTTVVGSPLILRVPDNGTFFLDLGVYPLTQGHQVYLQLHQTVTGVVEGSVLLDPVVHDVA